MQAGSYVIAAVAALAYVAYRLSQWVAKPQRLVFEKAVYDGLNNKVHVRVFNPRSASVSIIPSVRLVRMTDPDELRTEASESKGLDFLPANAQSVVCGYDLLAETHDPIGVGGGQVMCFSLDVFEEAEVGNLDPIRFDVMFKEDGSDAMHFQTDTLGMAFITPCDLEFGVCGWLGIQGHGILDGASREILNIIRLADAVSSEDISVILGVSRSYAGERLSALVEAGILARSSNDPDCRYGFSESFSAEEFFLEKA